MSRHLAVVLGLSALLLAACGDDDAPPAIDAGMDAGITDAGMLDAAIDVDAGPPDAPPADAGTSGRLTIVANGVTRASGKIVLVFITAPGGGAPLGGICAPVTSDPGDVSDVAKLPTAGDPCTLGAEVFFPNGSYDVSAGIYTPGMMTPERCATASATIVGDTTVTLPAFGACP